MIAYAKEVGQNVTISNQCIVSVAAAPSLGNVVIARVGFRTGGANVLSGVSDTKGNGWSIDVFNDQAGGHVAICSTGMDVGALTTSDTVTFQFSASLTNGGCVILDEFSGLDTSAGRFDQSSTTTATLTARATAFTGTTTVADELLITCYAGNAQETAFTTGAGFSPLTTPFLNRTTTAFVEGDYRVVAATGSYNEFTSGGVSTATTGAIATYKAATAIALVPALQQLRPIAVGGFA